jgi:NADH:ubiquinone oxidoreductase subunit 4 (subunit M)
MVLLFGKNDLRLIAVSIAAVFCHMSFDIILSGSTEFPVLAPFSGEFFTFSGIDWIIFQAIAVAIIITASVIVKINYSRYNYKQKFYSF